MGVSELGGVVAAAARLRVGERERVTGGGDRENGQGKARVAFPPGACLLVRVSLFWSETGKWLTRTTHSFFFSFACPGPCGRMGRAHPRTAATGRGDTTCRPGRQLAESLP